MTQQIEIDERLTDDELKKLTEYAKELISRRNVSSSPGDATSQATHRISFEGWAGCLAHVDPEKSNKQLLREAWDELIDKWERAGESSAK